MKQRVQKLSAILAAIMVGSLGVVFALSHVRAAGASIYMSPSSRSVVQNATTSFTVRANTGGAQVDTSALTITYDTSKLEFAGVSAASSPLSSPVAPYGNSGGTISGAYYTTTPVSGDIVLATITFKARVSSGSTTVQFSTGGNGTLIASGGSDLGASLGSATVNFTATPTTPPAPSNPTPGATTPTTNKPSSNGQSSGGNTSSGDNGGSDNPTTSSPTPTDPSSPSTTPTEGQAILMESDVIPELKIGVFDNKNKPVKNKEVTLHSEPQTAKTDSAGFATFTNVPLGNHTLRYTSGSTTHEMPVYVANADAQTVVLDFAQRNVMILWTSLTALVLATAALVVVLARRPGGLSLSSVRRGGPKPPAGPLGPNGVTDFAPPKAHHHWHTKPTAPGMVIGGPDGVKTFTEDK